MKFNKKKAKSLIFFIIIMLSTTIINATLFSIYNGNIDNGDQKKNLHNIEENPEEKPIIRTSSNNPPNGNYFNYYKIITIDHDRVDGTGSHLNFPLLISIFDIDLHVKVQSNGNDIAFANDTAWLDHEIELFNKNFNGTHAQLIAWVRIPSLSTSTDTTIYMYYGNSTMTSRENPTGVWDSNYKGVWHLSESSGGTDAIKDSTLNVNHGTDYGSPLFGSTGRIDGIIDLAGNIEDEYIELLDSASLTNITEDNYFTYEAWFNPDQVPPGIPLDHNDHRYGVMIKKDPHHGLYYDHGQYFAMEHWLDIGGIPTVKNVLSGIYSPGDYYHLVGVVSNLDGYIKLYVNGNLEDENTWVGGTTPWDYGTKNLRFGIANPGVSIYRWPADGKIDEFRISNIVRSAGWILTEYRNQNDPENFYSISTPYELFPPKPEYFNFYRIITIDHKKVSGNTDFIDFPLLISILDSDLRDQVQPDGDDIVFSNGTDFSNGAIWLDHEIEYFSQTYNPSYGKLVAWVRVPTLFHDKDTKIYMYYGNSTMTSRENPSRVWDKNYVMVQHMDESSNTREDSTIYNNDGIINGVDKYENGVIDGADSFDGLNYNDIVNISHSNSLSITNYITLEAWINPAQLNDYQYFIDKRDSNSPSENWFLALWNNNTIRFELFGVNNIRTYSTSKIYDADQWYHIVATYDGTSKTIYINGTKDKEETATGSILTNSHDLHIGTNWLTVYTFEGLIDEVRISNISRSADWITTEYNNQNDPKSFYSISSRIHVKRPNPEDFEYQKMITIDHTKVSGSSNLINFPVLISIFDEDLHDDVQPDGDDIAFWNGSAWLDHEIELFRQNYNGTHAQLIAWVQIPSISPSTDSIIYIYYGNSSLCSQEVPTGVWDSNYEGVWHLLESNGDAKDSTLANEYGAVSGTVTQGSTGQINGAYDFVTDGMVNVGDPTDGHLDFGPNDNFTISFWINVDANTGIYQFPLYKGGASNPDVGYNFETLTDGSGITFYICDGTNRQGSDTVGIIFDNWYYITGVVDKTNDYIHIYKDGTEVGSGTSISTIGNLTNNKDLRFSWDNYDLNGLLDEIRISNICYSSDWIATEYNNQDNPNSFYTIGIEQLVGLANIQVNTKDLYGLPVPNANVSIHNTYGIIKSALTDSDGSVLFQNINLGEYNFTVNITSNITPYETVVINTTSKAFEIYEPFHNINLICNASRNIFKLTDIDGNPVTSGWIIVSKGIQEIQNCTIDTTGQALFRWLNTTEYQYTVWYQDDNYNPNKIILASGEIPSANSTIELQVNLTTVEFTVYTDDGSETIGGAKLMFHNTTSGRSVVNFTTDFDGKAIFRWLNTSNFYNYSLKIRFYGEFKNFTMSGVGDAQGIPPQLEFSITANASYLIYLQLTSQALQEYETAIVSLNPTDNIMIEWGTNLTLRALFNVTKVPTGNTGPINADSMWYEIYDTQSTLVQSVTMSIEPGNIGRYQCKIKTNGLQSNIIYTIYIKAYKSEYVLPDDRYISLYLLKNEIILNQSENNDSIQIAYWQESINMSVTSYGKISEDFTLEDEIFHKGTDPFQFVIPDISNNWNLSQVVFNIYNISWNVAEEAYINITIVGPYDEFLKVDKNNASIVGSTYDFNQGWWTGIKFELNEISSTGDNTFKFTIGGTFDEPVDIIADAFFIRDQVSVEYRKFNVTGDRIRILSDGNGWVIKNITFDIYNCINTTSGSPILDIPTALLNISPYEGQNYTLVKTGDYTARVSIDNITIYPFEDQFLFDIHKLFTNIVFNVNITVHYIQKFYQNHYLESLYLSKTMYNFDKTVDTFQVSAGEDGWTDDNSAILMVSGIHAGANYFFPSEVAMNITIGVQTYSISDTPKGEGVFLLENIPGFNKNTLYTAVIETNQDVNYTLSFIVSNSRISIYEFEGTVVYKIQGTDITENVQYDGNLGCYMQTINTSLLYARTIPFTATFTCSMDHYESKSKDLDFITLERLTLISGSSTNIDLYPSIYVEDAINYTFSYTDTLLPSTKITDLDEASYTMTKLGTGGQSVSYGSGNLYVNVNNEYVIDLNTERLAVGRYTIWVLLDKQNYESKQAIIFLTVNEREIDYDLGDMFEEKQTSVVKGEKVTLSIELTDPTKGDIPLKGATVILEIGDDDLEFEEVKDGVYELEFDTKDYEAFFTSNTITGTIKISKANYTSEEIDITIVIEMEEIEVIPGVLRIPIFYLLVLIAAIGAVVGSLGTYKYIQIMKIPTFVKKIRSMKGTIKKSATISESLSITNKETYMINMVSDKWDSIGLSLEDILGITAKKGKTLPIIMGKTNESQKSADLIPHGLILMRWNERIGTEIVVKYPKDIDLSQKTLMQIYGAHEYTGESGMINLMVGNLNIASYYTGQEKGYYLVLILDIDDDADAYEGGMIDVIQVLLQNLEDDSYVKLIPSLFQRLAVYPTFNHEQHLLLTYFNELKRMILTRLRDEGVIAKSEIIVWLRDKEGEEFINLDAIIAELIKRELIKLISIKGMPSELSFLTGDLFMLRVPPVELIKNPTQRGLPSPLSKVYLNEIRKFFEQYRPTEFDSIKVIGILANPEVYQTFQLLRRAIVTKDDLEKLKKKGVDDISHVLKLLWDAHMINVLQDKSGTEYYCLLSDFYIKLIFPKYLLEVIKREYEQKSQSNKVLIEYLNILEDTYLNIKLEEKSK